MRYLGMSALVTVAVCIVASQVSRVGRAQEGGAEEAKPKHTIKAVMEAVHKGDAALIRKVIAGDASAEEKLTLLDHYISLAENKPPKGEAASWEEKTKALIAAAQDVVDGKQGAGPRLQQAANCMACHSAHKGG